MKQLIVMRSWDYPEQLTRLEEWVGNNTDKVWWDKLTGWTCIDGRIYHSNLMFYCEEDMMWCKIMFPEITR
jgi:hypothetical protein